MKFSSFKKDQLLMESWRRYLEEAFEIGEPIFIDPVQKKQIDTPETPEASRCEQLDKFVEGKMKEMAEFFREKFPVEVKAAEKEIKELEEQLLEGKEKLDEGAFLIAGLVLAAPAIAKIFAKVAEWLGEAIRKLTGIELCIEVIAKRVSDGAHALHHLYTLPIGKFVKLFVKDLDKAHKITNFLFHLMVAFFLVMSGLGAAEYVKQGKVGMAGLEGAMTAVKKGEVIGYIKSLFTGEVSV